MSGSDEDSLGHQVTRVGDVSGIDVSRVASQPDHSLGNRPTAGDAASSISDLGDEFASAEDVIEVVDLASRYEILGSLGRGGMGEVFLALDQRLMRQVAIKRIHGDLAANPRALTRFLTEARSIAALNHPGIVHVHDFGRDREGPFLILEYVEGGTLQGKLDAGPLPLADAIHIACQICDGLSAAHALGILHRDIKPANILLTSRGDARLSDFGLARHDQVETGVTSTGAILGTLDYMSPEQRQDAALADARSDLWSLAATLYQMVTGDVPRVIDLEGLPQSLRPVIATALKPRKEDRYQSAIEFRDALLACNLQHNDSVADLKDGECAHCHTLNSTDRKYCRQCGSALVAACLSCQAPLAVWEKFCGDCGANAMESLAAKRLQLQEECQRVRSLIQGYRYDEAIALLEPIAASTDRQFQDFTAWANEQLKMAREDSSRKREETERLVIAATEAVEQFQYSDARSFLSQIPEPLLDSEARQLLELAVSRSDRLQFLSREIRNRVQAKQYDGLLPLVEEFLTLKPVDATAQKLAERLRTRETRTTASRDQSRSFPDFTNEPSGSASSGRKPPQRTTVMVAVAVSAAAIMMALFFIMLPQSSTTQDPEHAVRSGRATGSESGKSTKPQPPAPVDATQELAVAILPESPPEMIEEPAEIKFENATSGRSTARARSYLAKLHGGTDKSEAAVRQGLRWLVNHQLPDGGFSYDLNSHPECHAQCTQSGALMGGGRTSATGTALLAFLGHGQTHESGDYQKEVKRALDFLLENGKSTPQGFDLCPKSYSNEKMYVQGLCTIALAELDAMTNDNRVRQAAADAVNFIINSQNAKTGGWRYLPYPLTTDPGDTSVMGWQIMALKSARDGGVSVPEKTFRMAGMYLDSVQINGGSRYGYDLGSGRVGTPTMTAVGLLCRMYLGWDRQNKELQEGVQYLASLKPAPNNMYYNYYATQVLFHWGGEEWSNWNRSMRDQLISTQRTAKDNHMQGSWDLADPHGALGGRLYMTCLCLNTLEVYYRYLPLYGLKKPSE
jgi:serine/threonine protein kinase